MLIAERIDRPQDEGRDQSTEERTPQSFQREVIGHLRTMMKLALLIEVEHIKTNEILFGYKTRV